MTSVLSLLLSVVLIAIAVAEIANSQFVKGSTSKEKDFLGIATCVNVTAGNATSEFRCIASVTFQQKLASATLLLIFGYFESLIAYHSLLTALAVSKKQEELRTRNISNVAPPVSVEAYFEDRIQNDPIYLNNQLELESGKTSPGLQPPEEFPDSDQFRAHLEGLEGNHT